MRYLIDTNILSEGTKVDPSRAVVARLETEIDRCAISSVSLYEVRFGVARMADGRRKARYGEYYDVALARLANVLSFDERAAEWLALERVRLQVRGTVRPLADSMIAAVATTNDLTLVTRNTGDFADFEGLRIENWFA